MKQQLGLKQGKLRKTSYDKSKRWLKFKYLFLFRAKGGTAMAAKGFSIGLAIEMFTLPTSRRYGVGIACLFTDQAAA